MSKAFSKETEPEDLEIEEADNLPAGFKNYITPNGLSRRQAELKHLRYIERLDMIRRSKYPDEEFVFSGQTVEGFVVFERIHADVGMITFRIPNVGTRYDFRSEPVETVDLVYRFKRDLRKMRTYDELATQVANP